MSFGEFSIIEEIFAPLSVGMPGAFGLTDDAATLSLPPGRSLVMTKDMMVEGVHFMGSESPDLIARKLLRVNISDLAAMGATPVGYLLAIALTAKTDIEWIRSFAAGLAKDQAEYSCGLMGGDTVATTGPLTLSITAFGSVVTGSEFRRNGAKAGDAVLVTGTIGDGALGLMAARGELEILKPAEVDFLADRYRLPQPRIAFAQQISARAAEAVHAAADLSDGLVADLGHICRASGLSAEIQWPDVAISDAARQLLEVRPACREKILTGGDDYELVITAAPGSVVTLCDIAAENAVSLSRVGTVTPGEPGVVRVFDEAGEEILLQTSGFTHF